MTVTETACVVELPGGRLDYTLRRSPRSRGLRVVIHPDRGVVVTVPSAQRRGWADAERHVRPFLIEREAWLRRHVDRHARERAELAARGGLRHGAMVPFRGQLHRLRIEAADVRRRTSVQRVGGEVEDELVVRVASTGPTIATVLERWFREQARVEIERAIARHTVALGVEPLAISVRDQRTRWGSASRKGRLAFSWRLVLAPDEALDTVVVHELAHLRVFGHGPRFWSLVASRRPDHARWRKWLRDHSMELHRALDTNEGLLDVAS